MTRLYGVAAAATGVLSMAIRSMNGLSTAAAGPRVASNPSRYHPALVTLHWISALLLLAALASGLFFLDETPNTSPGRIALLRGHMILGITILFLTTARFAARAFTSRPAPATAGNVWFDRLALATHYGLYVAIILMAASGLVTAVTVGLLAIVFGGSGAPLPETLATLPPRVAHAALAKVIIALVSFICSVLSTITLCAGTVCCDACGSASAESQTPPQQDLTMHDSYHSRPAVVRCWMMDSMLRARRGALTGSLWCIMAVAAAHEADAAEQFGKVHFPIACDAGVQEKFDLAVAMLHTFSFPAAAETFTAVSHEDSDCAMAYWGLAAAAMGSLYGGRPGPRALQGELAVQKAKAIGGKTPREQDYIAAIDAFYRDADRIDYGTRVHRYADALEQLQYRYPYDLEAAVLYAYALSARGSPTDQTFAYQLKGAAILERLLKEQPDHPGVMHYLLHAYDNTAYAARGLATARRFAKVAPSSPHALQFPAHIFVRLGLWQESIDTNRIGAAVDDLFFKPHALDFLVYSYLQTGQDAAARRVVDEAATIEIIPHILDAYAMAAMPARYAIERRRWDEAAALTLPQSDFAWELFPHAEAALVFVRALGAARTGDINAARSDLDRLQGLSVRLREANSEGTWQEFWVSQLENHRQIVAAWIAYEQGRREAALRMLRAAAAREDSTEKDPVMPGQLVSARQLLGEMLLDANDPVQALQAFEAA